MYKHRAVAKSNFVPALNLCPNAYITHIGAYISELDRKKQIFLKHSLGTSFLSGMAFTICEVCTQRERHLQNFQVSLGGRHL